MQQKSYHPSLYFFICFFSYLRVDLTFKVKDSPSRWCVFFLSALGSRRDVPRWINCHPKYKRLLCFVARPWQQWSLSATHPHTSKPWHLLKTTPMQRFNISLGGLRVLQEARWWFVLSENGRDRNGFCSIFMLNSSVFDDARRRLVLFESSFILLVYETWSLPIFLMQGDKILCCIFMSLTLSYICYPYILSADGWRSFTMVMFLAPSWAPVHASHQETFLRQSCQV